MESKEKTEAEVSQREIYRGRLENLPDNTSNIVRIFLSSTFTDTVAERNILLEKAYPELRQFCAEHGLDFQVVDMRWGVRDAMTSDHHTTELCLNEIYNCQRLSMGPNFCLLLGGRYGTRPLPAKIEGLLLKTIEKFAKEDDIKVSLIDEWYHLDSNAVPPEYILQPITDKFPYFIDDNPKNRELQKKAKSDWWEVNCEISAIFRAASAKALKQKCMTFKDWQLFNISVTEDEIKRGLLDTTGPTMDKCIIINRDIDDVDFNDAKAYRYVDMNDTKDAMNEENAALLENLKEMVIPTKIPENEIKKYQLQWETNGINPSIEAHEKYLEDINQFFVSKVKAMTLTGLKERSNAASNWLFDETLQHLNMCAARSKSYNCRKESQRHVDEYINDDTNNAPFVIHGVSGIGKTSFMSKITSNAIEQQCEDSAVIVRFLGTSPKSSLITDTLQSVCLHICEAFGYDAPKQPLNDINAVMSLFQELIKIVSKDGHKLIVCLDSLDQLSPIDGAYDLSWLPFELPQGIKIIISLLTEYAGILKRCERCIENTDNILQLGPLNDDESKEIMNTSLANVKRTITKDQMSILESAFMHCNSPLFLKLAFEEAKTWRSYSNLDETTLGNTIQGGITLLFERLEEKHGQLFCNAMAYITASKNGVTDLEMENLLSSSNEVLDDVYQYFSPPVKHLVRVPPLLWARLRQDIHEYLSERQADGKTVLALYHRQFIEVAKKLYLSNSVKTSVHSELADMFLGVWSNGKKKELYLTKRKETLLADRKVEPQPLCYEGGYYNMRKLNELPFHLLRSGRHEELIDVCFGNFKWINTKIKATNILAVIRDIEMAIAETSEVELVILRDALRLIKPTVEFTPGVPLAPEIIGRLLIKADKHLHLIGKLVSQAIQYCEEAEEDILIPTVPCFISPGGVLRTTLVGHKQGVNDASMNEDCSLMVTASSDHTAKLWDLKDDIVIHSLFHLDPVESCLLLSKKNIIVTFSNLQIFVWDTSTRKLRHTLELGRTYNGGQMASTTKTLHKTLTTKPKMCALLNGNVVCAVRGAVFVVDIAEGKVVIEVKGGDRLVSCLSICQGTLIIVGYHDGCVSSISTADDGEDELYLQHKDEVTGLATTANSGTIASVSLDGSIVVYDTTMRKVIQHINPNESEPLYSVALPPDEEFVAVGSINAIRVWTTKDGRILHKFLGHSGVVNSLCFTGYSGESRANGPTLVSAASDCSVKVWDLGNNELKSTYTGMAGNVTKLIINDDYDTAVSISDESPFVKIWHLNPNLNDVVPEFQNDTEITPVIFPDGKHVVALDADYVSIMMFDMVSGKKVFSTLAHDAPITSMVCTSCGNHVITGGIDHTARVWQKERLLKMSLRYEFESEVRLVATHPNKNLFVVALSDNRIKRCHVERHECDDVEVDLTDADITTLAMSDELIIYGTDNGKIYAWSFDSTAHPVHVFQKHSTPVNYITVQNNLMASVAKTDKHIQIWDVTMGRNVHQLEIRNKFNSQLPRTVTAISFLHDGKILGVGCYERSVELYDVVHERRLLPDGQYVYFPVTHICSSKNQNILVATQNGFLSSYKPHIHVTTNITMEDMKGQSLTKSNRILLPSKENVTTYNVNDIRKIGHTENVRDNKRHEARKEHARVVPNKELYRRAVFIQGRHRNASQTCTVM
ncbi:unnamed protein product [Owenia fusiformis]|uniref:Uncharacterized protein n=1 Tax=Owenia fusiformis TaxID=6347 RepID=A0A8S4Q6S0_OWEFU|nr:unnamed protein product [Owenia fusiformis]